MTNRIDYLKEIVRYSTFLKVKIPETIFNEKTNYDKFKQVQESYNELKKDNTLNINEEVIKEIKDNEEYRYKIITITTKKRNKYENRKNKNNRHQTHRGRLNERDIWILR